VAVILSYQTPPTFGSFTSGRPIVADQLAFGTDCEQSSGCAESITQLPRLSSTLRCECAG
jgi:hypothetical protein